MQVLNVHPRNPSQKPLSKVPRQKAWVRPDRLKCMFFRKKLHSQLDPQKSKPPLDWFTRVLEVDNFDHWFEWIRFREMEKSAHYYMLLLIHLIEATTLRRGVFQKWWNEWLSSWVSIEKLLRGPNPWEAPERKGWESPMEVNGMELPSTTASIPGVIILALGFSPITIHL